METRRVQVTGGSSYIITLPKEWVRANGVQRTALVGVVERSDGTLVVSPTPSEQPRGRRISFDVEGVADPRYVFRLLVGAYMRGATEFEVAARSRIHPDVRGAVARFVSDAIGPEIVDESDGAMLIRDLLNPTEMPLDRTVKRMHMLVRGMHSDAVASVLGGDGALAAAVPERDREVNRLHWLVEHQVRIVSREAHLLDRMAVSRDDADYYFLASRVLERIGDHAARIALQAPVLAGVRAPGVHGRISDASEGALSLLQDALASWFSRDPRKANATIEAVGGFAARCDAIAVGAPGAGRHAVLPLGYVAESIRRTGEYSADLAELAIDHLVGGGEAPGRSLAPAAGPPGRR
jgi:phosphate uptake regulator